MLVYLCFGHSITALAQVAVSTNDDETSPLAQSVIWTKLLSPDGKWLVYEKGRPPTDRGLVGSVVVTVKQVEGKQERQYEAGETGPDGSDLKMSRSGKWIVFSARPSDSSQSSAESGIALVNVAHGERRDLANVSHVEFTAGNDEYLVVQQQTGNDTSKLHLIRLSDSTESVVDSVKQLAVSSSGKRIAWSGKRGLYDYNLRTRKERQLDSDHELQNPTLAPDGNAVLALRVSGGSAEIVAYLHLETPSPQKVVVTPSRANVFPAGYELVPSFRWRSDSKSVFFQIKPQSATSSTSGANHVRIWRWNDPVLPGEKTAWNSKPDWYFLDLENGDTRRLSDVRSSKRVELTETAPNVLLHDSGQYGPANMSTYRDGSTIPQLRDYEVLDLKTGRHTALVRGLRVITRVGAIVPQLSPDGSVALYQDNEGEIVIYCTATGERLFPTRDLRTQFYFPENAPQIGWMLRDVNGLGHPRIQGWSTDGRYVLVSDLYDVWALPLIKGIAAVNVTGNGRATNIMYRLRRFQTRGPGVDLQEPMYFDAFDLNTGESGIVRTTKVGRPVQQLYWEYASLNYLKQPDATDGVVCRTSAAKPEQCYRTKDWAPSLQLTSTTGSERRPAGGTKYLAYLNARGERRAAILYRPVNYEQGRSYPAIVEIYKGWGLSNHVYRGPGDYIYQFLERGYAFLQPEIVPRLDDAGPAALEDVNAGVEAAIATGVVDRSHLGLMGHSFGGFETNFIVTQSQSFAAALSYAGTSNLWSAQGGVYSDNWPRMDLDQPFISGPWWDNWDVILRNSPLIHVRGIRTPLLLVHGDQDMQVSFDQSLQLFNALRRLGDRPIVLLEYKGAGHDFEGDDMDDFRKRRLEYFDHFLRGEPAPSWWNDSLPKPLTQ